MIEILENLLNDYYPIIHGEECPAVESKAETPVQPQSDSSQYARDIEVLQLTYGELTRGMEINLSLHQALELLPRTRKRSDAYKGLQTELKKLYGVALNVGEQHTHNYNNEQESGNM